MRTARLTDPANRDLESIWVYIAKNNFDAADRVYDQVQAEIQKLCVHPGMGHTRLDSENPDHRFWKIYSYLIVYRYDATTLTVLRIIHGARDIASILK